MLSLEEGKKAVEFARNIIEEKVKADYVSGCKLSGVFDEKHGAFVTLHTYPKGDLRGCIGVPMPVMGLKDAIAEGASSATNDPRFPPLTENELDKIAVEVTVLSQPEKIKVDDPKEYPNKIKVGRDGLIVEKSYQKGLLLPQVPVEQNWDEEEFLNHTCMKAGLTPDSWYDSDTKISKFSGQIFTEVEPYGEVEEKKI
ncbi:MAG: TIGR00296 family protein [Candidatus Thermoplasmatota archaeon]